MNIEIPELCLVVLIGPSGSGKSTFAKAHFGPFETISSDFCRGVVSNDVNSLDATGGAFELLHYIIGKRLERGLLTVVDATNVQEESRRALVRLAKEHDVLPIAIVLSVSEDVCHERNRSRPDRDFGPHVIRNQHRQMRRSIRGLSREGFRSVFELHNCDAVAAAQITRVPVWNDRRHDSGPFDIVGDVHGCFDELSALLGQLGYAVNDGAIAPPPGRKLVFLGDLVDRGPKAVEVLKLVMAMVSQGSALCVPGNHDVKLLRHLRGRKVQLTHGLAETVQQLNTETEEFRRAVADFLDRLVSHYVLDGGRLVVAHAGIKQRYIGRTSGRVREFCLYGETTGESDEFGLPVRLNWAAEYRGSAHVVYGHTPVLLPDWLNRTMNIDTGCAFGGKLTALRWPEKEIVQVDARVQYAVPARPLNPHIHQSLQQQHDDVLDVADVIGKRIIDARLHHNITVREENAITALEVMSRFAVDPKWLIYLPPTMSPVETSRHEQYLEHPEQAFEYFARVGLTQVICEEKHMGSRAVAIVCRDSEAATRRFGVKDESAGIIYTRTGRRFFNDPQIEADVLRRLRDAFSAASWWDRFTSDWFCLDCELMPWSAKAQELLQKQYAPVGSAGLASLNEAVSLLQQASARYGEQITPLLERADARKLMLERYVESYRNYCWPVNSVSDLKVAPFHILAGEGRVFDDRDHYWHMTTLSELPSHDPLIVPTNHRAVEITDPASVSAATRWWEQLTNAGGEGMVVKGMSFTHRGSKGLTQPAIKVRGPEYLRIIYGPEYLAPDNLVRLKRRAVQAKRSLAVREFALGLEALHRFVEREPLRCVHECVFAVLALESEPVDPRL